ncbi:MAG: FecR domain-containing protein [Longimonas sp.]|uniref:FecR family protein n=1 Tax=Longimonas sp. TaxID=2039626 RepID=UPI00335A718F
MDTLFEAILFYDDLSEEKRAAVRDQLNEHPEMRQSLVRWMQVRTAVRQQLEADLPDRHLLVLYALDQAGLGHTLDPGEREALKEAAPRIESARDAHPALQDVIQRIQDEQVAFEETWAEHVTEVQDAQPAHADRSARAPAGRHTEDRSWAWRLAAGFAMLFIAVSVIFFLPSAPTTTTVDVAEGEVRTLTLADGSSVRLSGVTRFTYPDEVPEGDAPAYVVSIQTGKAFFEVPEHVDRSFIVETPTARAEVIGTQFGVDTAPHHTDITLAEGALQIGAPATSASEMIQLAPGQMSRVERDESPSPPQSIELNESLAWTGLFLFRQTPVDALADQLSRAYGVSVTADADLASERITGTFERDQPIGDILNAVAATLGGAVEQPASDTYRLTQGS